MWIIAFVNTTAASYILSMRRIFRSGILQCARLSKNGVSVRGDLAWGKLARVGHVFSFSLLTLRGLASLLATLARWLEMFTVHFCTEVFLATPLIRRMWTASYVSFMKEPLCPSSWSRPEGCQRQESCVWWTSLLTTSTSGCQSSWGARMTFRRFWTHTAHGMGSNRLIR